MRTFFRAIFAQPRIPHRNGGIVCAVRAPPCSGFPAPLKELTEGIGCKLRCESLLRLDPLSHGSRLTSKTRATHAGITRIPTLDHFAVTMLLLCYVPENVDATTELPWLRHRMPTESNPLQVLGVEVAPRCVPQHYSSPLCKLDPLVSVALAGLLIY